MKKLGIGLIGLGQMGRIHLQHGRKLNGAEVVAVCDLSKKALRQAKVAGVKKAFTDYKTLIKDPEVEAVVISLPTHLHLESAREAAEAGKDVFLEKPIARNPSEAQEIVSSAQKNSVKLMMGYPFRFNPRFRGLKTRIDDGTLGDVVIANANYVCSGPFFHRIEGYAPTPVPDWWFNKKLTGGGVLADLGSHMINLLRWYFGEVNNIRCYLGYRLNMDFEDTAICLCKFDSNTKGVINIGWFSQEYLLKVEVMGSVQNTNVQHNPSNPLLTVVQIASSGISNFYRPHFNELQYFVQCLINDKSPSPSGDDGLKDLMAIHQAYANQIELD